MLAVMFLYILLTPFHSQLNGSSSTTIAPAGIAHPWVPHTCSVFSLLASDHSLPCGPSPLMTGFHRAGAYESPTYESAGHFQWCTYHAHSAKQRISATSTSIMLQNGNGLIVRKHSGLCNWSLPGGRNIALAKKGPWRDTRMPVRAITLRDDSKGASGVAVYWRTLSPKVRPISCIALISSALLTICTCTGSRQQ